MAKKLNSLNFNYSLRQFQILFIFINTLFIYKYGLRQNIIDVHLLLIIYLIFSLPFLYKNPFKNLFFDSLPLKKYYFLVCLLIVIILFLIVFYTDGTLLKVDRWSAMDASIKALLRGEYPYTATDHLHGRTSNFPGLLLLGIPFYMLGNVGYLEVFSFALLGYTLYKCCEIKQAFYYIILVLLSPAYWWEIFAVSDLFSNIVIAFCFILLVNKKSMEERFQHPFFLGITTCILILTRGIVAIPLTLFLFKDFTKIILSQQLKYILAFTFTFVALLVMVLMNCPSMETLKLYNPLVLQTHYLPNYIHIIAVVLPFYFSFKIKSFTNNFFQVATLLMLFPTLLAFLLTWYRNGFVDLIENSSFDLSYLSIVIPFLLFEITKNSNLNHILN